MRTRLGQKKLNALLWIAAAVWCCVLFFLSGQSGEVTTQETLDIVNVLLRSVQNLRGGGGQFDFAALSQLLLVILRKLAHFGVFIVQGLLLGGALLTGSKPPKRSCAWAAAGCALIGVLNELHQSIVPGRECKFTDMLINAAGGALGVLLALLLLRRALRRREQNPKQNPKQNQML